MRYFELVVLIFLTGCISEYKLDESYTEGEIVVNGIIRPGIPAAIYLTKTGSIGQQAELEDPDSVIVVLTWLVDQSTLADTLFYNGNNFQGKIALMEGISYKLDILTKEGTRISSETEIPLGVGEYSANVRFPAGFINLDNFTGPFSRITLQLPDIANGIYWESMVIEEEMIGGENGMYNIQYCINDDTETLAENLPSNYLPYFLFQYEAAEEDTLILNFDNIQGSPLINKFIFRLSLVSDDYFLYKKSLLAHLDALEYSQELESKSLFFPDIFKQVVPVYSNVIGGKGIFAGYNPKDVIINCNLSGNECI